MNDNDMRNETLWAAEQRVAAALAAGLDPAEIDVADARWVTDAQESGIPEPLPQRLDPASDTAQQADPSVLTGNPTYDTSAQMLWGSDLPVTRIDQRLPES